MTSANDHRRIADGSVDRAQARVLSSPNALKLGVFAANLSGGATAITSYEGPPRMRNWDEARRIGVAADRAGFEAMVPISRWKGFGGPTGHWDRSFETFGWGAGLAEATERIQIFTTCAVPLFHPVMAAKMGATLDHISNGRWGLNIIPGWLGTEFKMFGIELGARGSRYKLAQEWITIVNRLWTESEEFDFDGEFFQFTGAVSEPKPVQRPRPVVMNAGQSAEGQQFAVNNADMIFINLGDTEGVPANIASIRAAAKERNKEVSIWGNIDIICRDTEAEAREYAAEWMRAADDEATARYVAQVLGGDAGSQAAMRANPELAHALQLTGGNKGVIGTPEQVAGELANYSALGIDGMTLTWHDYETGLQQFITDIHPLLVEAGLRSEVPLDS
jgi:alkanesulfonate monooxygenase SsuD/methylene tetrahydromethanopterin reductase-like flavin-dependent oxidoreductase (luciferase family)